MQTALVCYIPVLHQGYFQFLKKYQGGCLYILGQGFIDEFTGLHHEIRALDPSIAKKAIHGLRIFDRIEIMTKNVLVSLGQFSQVILPDEEISRKFAEKYLPSRAIKFESVFLRWDEKNVLSQKPVNFDRKSNDPFDLEMIARTKGNAKKSSDWWRQVGACVVKDREVILEDHNQHVPSEHMPYINGDPRDFVAAGKNPHINSTLHAEQAIIAEAANRGISLAGTNLYVTIFPCAMCAHQVAYSGVKKVFFGGGHASLDGQEVLKAKGVELIFVK